MIQDPKHFRIMAKRALLPNNFYLKLTALMLAIIVWFVFHRNDQSTSGAKEDSEMKNRVKKSFELIPISVMQPSGEFRRFSVSVSGINLVLSGDSSILNRLTTNEIRAYVDTQFFQTDTTILPVRVHVPKGIQVDQTFPSEVHIRLLSP